MDVDQGLFMSERFCRSRPSIVMHRLSWEGLFRGYREIWLIVGDGL
jgi:hypothetical protein